jgi:hypothetical protein
LPLPEAAATGVAGIENGPGFDRPEAEAVRSCGNAPAPPMPS